MAGAAGSVWIPLAAKLTTASRADSEIAPRLLEQLPVEVRYVLGDTHDNTPELRDECGLHHRELVATRRGPYPYRDGGVEVRCIFDKLRSKSIEPFNGLFSQRLDELPTADTRRDPALSVSGLPTRRQRHQGFTLSGMIYEHVSFN